MNNFSWSGWMVRILKETQFDNWQQECLIKVHPVRRRNLIIRWIEWYILWTTFPPPSPVLDQWVHEQNHDGGREKLPLRPSWVQSLIDYFHFIIQGWAKGLQFARLNSMEFLLPVMTWLMWCWVCNVLATETNTRSPIWHHFSIGAASHLLAVWLHWEIIMEGTEVCSHYSRHVVWAWICLSCL